MIAGLVAPDRGRIALDDTVLFDSAARINVPPHRRRIGYVFQEGRLFPHLTVAGNLDYGRRMSGLARDPAEARCADRRAARHRPPARPPARQALGRRAPARRDRPRAADAPAAAAARRAAGLARCRAQARDPALSGTPARRGRQVPMVYVSHHGRRRCGGIADRWCGSTGRGRVIGRRAFGIGGQAEAQRCDGIATRLRGYDRRRMFPPERIVCLTEETVETLYLLGEEGRIVGVSGYAVRPPRVRREKPRVSAFISRRRAENPRAQARPGADVLRPAGRHRGRADPPASRCTPSTSATSPASSP